MKRLALLFSLALLLAAGCATLPGRHPLAPEEEARGRDLFRQLAAGQQACRAWVDAEAGLTFDSVWQSGFLPGYLQLLAPGFLRFVGIGPLGQPLLILATDGQDFSTVLPAERRVYEGPVTASAFQRYFPDGFAAAASYYWLTGRLRPGRVQVREVTGAEGSPDLWVVFSYAGEAGRELVRLDPEHRTLRRHLLLDEQDGVVLEAAYGDYTSGLCPQPGQVTIRGGRHGSLELRLRDWQETVPLTAADFETPIPPGFNRIKIP
jgi:hypothetical protein